MQGPVGTPCLVDGHRRRVLAGDGDRLDSLGAYAGLAHEALRRLATSRSTTSSASWVASPSSPKYVATLWSLVSDQFAVERHQTDLRAAGAEVDAEAEVVCAHGAGIDIC